MQRTFYKFLAVSTFFGVAILTPSSNLHAQGEGAKIFKANCVVCHADDGSASSVAGKALGAKDLRSHEVQEKTNPELIEFVTQGKDKMPSFGKKLKPTEIKEVIIYVRSLAAKK